MAGLTVVACAESAPPEPEYTVPPYQGYIQTAETAMSAGSGVGLIYVHPRRKRACNIMRVRLSRKVYNGLEHSWEIDRVIDLEERINAPEGKRHLGTYPVLFESAEEGPFRIDAMSCEAYDKTEIAQFQTLAEFELTAGELSYIGDFTQTRIVEPVDMYVPTDAATEAKVSIGTDSVILEAAFVDADVQYFEFENFDGKTYNSQQVIDNVERSGDYYTLSQTLKTQADDALLPFLGHLPDFRFGINGPDAKSRAEKKLTSAFNLMLFRANLQREFELILRDGKPYDVARDYMHLKVDVENAERKIQMSQSRQRAYTAEQIALATQKALEAHIKAHRLEKLLKQDVAEDQREARKAWRKEMQELPYVLTRSFSSKDVDAKKRDRVQSVLKAYVPAKYAALKIEFSKMGERRDLPPAEMREMRRLIDIVEAEEAIILEELVTEFLQENLAKNEKYHTALNTYQNSWSEILMLAGIEQ